MNQFFDIVNLNVIIDDKSYLYKRIYTDKYPNYYPSEENDNSNSILSDEILFLPTEPDSFHKFGDTRLVGFKYEFTTAGHETISINKDPTLLGVTTMELTANVYRFRYYFTNENTIIIEKLCDPLTPPRIFNVDTPSSFVGHQVQNLIKGMITQWNGWYAEKDV